MSPPFAGPPGSRQYNPVAPFWRKPQLLLVAGNTSVTTSSPPGADVETIPGPNGSYAKPQRMPARYAFFRGWAVCFSIHHLHFHPVDFLSATAPKALLPTALAHRCISIVSLRTRTV